MEKGTVERAIELAAECTTVDELRNRLRREGYASVDAHLQGRAIQNQLRELMKRG